MKLLAGSSLGPYEILAPLGAGGMGEVYRARDPRLGREVAVKVLPEQYSEDMERLRRFEQEARAVGALNHPNILTVYDIGTHEESPYVVSELLNGETLRERMGGSPIGTHKSVEYGLQIARGLAAAHEKGIVHRDLKPENIFVTRDGRIKILDFGLAKLTAPEPIEAKQSVLPTIDPGTQPGVILGTVGYMSPEQVRGRAIDHRSDIFSFGAILYEMLAGQRAFHRDSTADTMSAILREEPPELSESGKSFPLALERVLRHCLEKNVEERFQSARDLAFDLETVSGVSSASITEIPVAQVPTRRFGRFAWMLLIAALGLVFGFFVGRSRPVATTQDSPSSTSFQALTFRRGFISEARFAPDRQTILYSAAWGFEPSAIFSTRPQSPVSRSLGLPTSHLLSISSSGEMAILLNPEFFSGWQRDGTLARVPIDGGAPREVLEHVQDADWAPDGQNLAVARNLPGAVSRLEYPVNNVLYETSGWISHVRISPDGKMIGFLDHPGPGDDRGHVSVIDSSGNKKDLTDNWASESGLAWSATGDEIWFTASETGGNQQQLYGVSLSGKRRIVASMAGNLVLQDVSPGGEVLVSQESRRREMIVLPPGEKTERDLSWFDWSYPRDLSDDGKVILFEEQGAGGGYSYSVYLRSTDGSPAVRLGEGYAISLSNDQKWAVSSLPGAIDNPLTLLPTGAGQSKTLPANITLAGFAVDWFQDNKRLMVNSTGDQNRSWVYHLETGEMKPLTPEGIFGLGISRDDRFVFARETKSGNFLLYPLDGGEPREITSLHPDDNPVQISYDERFVYVAPIPGPIPYPVHLVDLTTGERKLWKEISPPDPAGISEISGFIITPDGRSYTYSYRRVLSDLYLGRGLK